MQSESKYFSKVDYLDFDLEIGQGSGQRYPVRVLRSAAGEANEVMDFPFSDLTLENQLLVLQNALLHSDKHRRIPVPEEQAVQSFGQMLFEALLTGEVRRRYAVSQREALFQGKGMRVKLHIQSPELATLPWEFLYDPEWGEYVCLSRSTPLVRYLELPSPPQPLTVSLPLRILGMSASPQNLPRLDLERERERVKHALNPLQERGVVRLTWLEGQTWQDLQRAMRHGSYHVFHFIGHGGFNALTEEGFIALSNEEGQANLLSATLLGRMLADHWPLRLVILNACEGARGGKKDIFSSTAATLVRRGISAVLAMQYEITDRAAIELSRAFYDALADGMPVDAALAEARKAISFAIVNTLEWGTPVLYMRSPNGVLFHTKAESTPPEHTELLLPKPETPGRNKEASSTQATPGTAGTPSAERKPALLSQVSDKKVPVKLEPPGRNKEVPSTQATPGTAGTSPAERKPALPPQVPDKKVPVKLEQSSRNKEVSSTQATLRTVDTSSSERKPTLPVPAPDKKVPASSATKPPTPITPTTTTPLRNPPTRIRRLAPIVFPLLLVMIVGVIFLLINFPFPWLNKGACDTTDVHMEEDHFAHQCAVIRVGDSINLINNTTAHHIIKNGTWDKPGPESGAPEAHDIELKTASQERTLGPFNKAGTFRYYCECHPNMILIVTVQE